MPEFVENCPRCGSQSITFDVLGDSATPKHGGIWFFEVLACCRHCDLCSIGLFRTPSAVSGTFRNGAISQVSGALTGLNFLQFVTVANNSTIKPPAHLPENVARCFEEGAASFSIGAYNAAAAMFRLALDLATKGLLPDVPAEEGGPNREQRKRLYDRLDYLFDKRLLAPELRELADCVREDGNDGAHDGTLQKEDAEDLIDFAEQLLERVYTEPARLRLAKARRDERRER